MSSASCAAFRLIAKERWFAAVAIVTLALGIGVNAIGFTIVNTAFFKPLALPDAGRLYAVVQATSSRVLNASYPDLQNWRQQSQAFDGLAAFSNTDINLSDDRAWPEQAQGTWVTANLFGQLGQQPILGRDFAPGDEPRGAERVAILGYRLWQNRYGGDPNVIGRSLRLDGEPATIVGVMPDGMRFPDSTEVWALFHPTPAQELRDARILRVFGRLKNDVSPAEAQVELTTVAQRLSLEFPDTNKELTGIQVEPLRQNLFGGLARTMFLTVMAAVGFVLLIACANVASSIARSFVGVALRRSTALPASRPPSSTSGWRRSSSLAKIRSAAGCASPSAIGRRARLSKCGGPSLASVRRLATGHLRTAT